MRAVCIQCGNNKPVPASRCSACSFLPQTSEDKARSLILSTDYEIESEYRGKTKEELATIATAIAQGQPYAFDESEVRSVVEYAERVLSIPAKQLVIDGLKWLLPPIVALLTVYLLIFWKR